MTRIYESPSKIIIDYDGAKQRAEIKPQGNSEKSNSIAMLCFQNVKESLWEKFQCFCLENLTWNWIKVNDPNSTSMQIVNMASISRHLGMKRDEIRKFNQSGTLYNEICNRYEQLGKTPAPLEIESIQEPEKISKRTEIKNSKEIEKIQRKLDFEDGKSEITIYYDTITNDIQWDTKGSVTFRKSYVFSSEITESYRMKATLYNEDDKYYVSIGNISPPLNRPNAVIDQSDTMRQEVLDIFQSSKE